MAKKAVQETKLADNESKMLDHHLRMITNMCIKY